MLKSKLEKFKKILQDKKKELENELKNLGKENPRLKGDFEATYPDYGSSLEDSAMEFESYIEALPVEYRLEKRLQMVEKALEKIRKGKYGVCENCGKKISERRLEIVPEARFCIDCEKSQRK